MVLFNPRYPVPYVFCLICCLPLDHKSFSLHVAKGRSVRFFNFRKKEWLLDAAFTCNFLGQSIMEDPACLSVDLYSVRKIKKMGIVICNDGKRDGGMLSR